MLVKKTREFANPLSLINTNTRLGNKFARSSTVEYAVTPAELVPVSAGTQIQYAEV